MRIAFDIETDGLLRDLSVIHCIAAQDIDTKEIYRFGPDEVKPGLKLLQDADVLYGHNIIGYDFQAIKELYPRWKYSGKAYDTLILSRLFFTDILDRDFRSRPAGMPANLYGRHSLESWGHRLGFHKSQFGKTLNGDWSTYSPEMLDYCQRDVEVSTKLVELFLPKMEEQSRAIETEHTLAHIMAWKRHRASRSMFVLLRNLSPSYALSWMIYPSRCVTPSPSLTVASSHPSVLTRRVAMWPMPPCAD